MDHIGRRLNYIGSKFPLLDWILEALRTVVGLDTLEGVRIADLFAGTGIVSYVLRTHGATVLSNDVELYSSIVAHAMTRSVYTPRCAERLATLNATPGACAGYITQHYSPVGDRLFFTEANATRMDFLRQKIEDLRPELSHDEYQFLLASLIVSADAVSNVPAVYGCYLKAFKSKALAPLTLTPVHTNPTPPQEGSATTQCSVETLELPAVDVVYLDPPYNGRQYSKNYFPLTILAKSPDALVHEPPLKGKTGIPEGCFISPFCQKKTVEAALADLVARVPARWVLLSYSSEGLLTRAQVETCLARSGTVTVLERPYKRFKSFEYNETAPVTEYLFCLHKS
jgi:adenine-specific DNA-methyltransferase